MIRGMGGSPVVALLRDNPQIREMRRLLHEHMPHGRAARATEMPVPLRYVILHHTGHGRPHFDLMFETADGSPLATWQSSEWPPTGHLTPVADHRRAYLDYDGPVSNHRGEVRRVAAGTHELIENTADRLVVRLDDHRVLELGR